MPMVMMFLRNCLYRPESARWRALPVANSGNEGQLRAALQPTP